MAVNLWNEIINSVNFDTLLSRSKLDTRLKYTFDMFLIFSILISFHTISYTFWYNLDMIFYHQSLFDTLLSVSKCIWHTLSVSKVNQNKVSNFDRSKVYQSSARVDHGTCICCPGRQPASDTSNYPVKILSSKNTECSIKT